MKLIKYLLMVCCANEAFATSLVKSCPGPDDPFDLEASKAIYFDTIKHEAFRTVVAHVPLPKKYPDARPQNVYIALLKPSAGNEPLIQLKPEFELQNHEVIIRFQGPVESDFEARVSLHISGDNVSGCGDGLTSTYKFNDSTYGFKSFFH